MFLFLILVVLFSILFYYKLIRPCGYWKAKSITHVSSWPLVGSMGKVVLGNKHFMDIQLDLYKEFHNERFVGYMQFTRPHLLLRDLTLIKQVGVKDFDNFEDRALCFESERDPLLSKSLVALKGEQWKELRATLSPVFASNNLRTMYTLIEDCAQNFVNNFQTDVEIEAKELFSKFANDVIATAVFGIQVDSVKEPNNEFFSMGVILSNFTTCQTIKSIISQTSKTVFRVEIFPKHATAFFRAIIMENIRKREAEGIIRPDLIQLLMDARKGKLKHEFTKEKMEGFATAEEVAVDNASNQIELTDDHIVAQAILLFSSGFETVSTACSFMAYELAISPDIQKKLQKEIDLVTLKYPDKVPYEVLLSMKYLDQVLSETLRLWPPTFQTNRLCVKNYLIEASTSEEKPFLIEKGVAVVIPTISLHRDPQYYPEPFRFDPERFSEENKSKILPGTYLPFGIGPRNCIGSRFALLEIKTLFCHLLSKFDIVPIEKTLIPMKISPKTSYMVPEKGIWLGLKPRKAKSS